MLYEERLTYETLKIFAFEDYYTFCRDSGLVDHRSHEEVLGRVYYSHEDGFERPIENLMWKVILYVLSGGWHPDWCRIQRQLIVDSIARHNLDNLLENVPTDEADAFRHDLKILKLIEK